MLSHRTWSTPRSCKAQGYASAVFLKPAIIDGGDDIVDLVDYFNRQRGEIASTNQSVPEASDGSDLELDDIADTDSSGSDLQITTYTYS